MIRAIFRAIEFPLVLLWMILLGGIVVLSTWIAMVVKWELLQSVYRHLARPAAGLCLILCLFSLGLLWAWAGEKMRKRSNVYESKHPDTNDPARNNRRVLHPPDLH